VYYQVEQHYPANDYKQPKKITQQQEYQPPSYHNERSQPQPQSYQNDRNDRNDRNQYSKPTQKQPPPPQRQQEYRPQKGNGFEEKSIKEVNRENRT